jgi:hypothetical protein
MMPEYVQGSRTFHSVIRECCEAIRASIIGSDGIGRCGRLLHVI